MIKYVGLIYQLTKREIAGRYRGSVLDVLWAFIIPLLMLVVYTTFFSVILKVKWGIQNESRSDFAILLFVGLVLYGFIADCIIRAPGLITSNVNYVKKVVFPLEVLPIVACSTSLFHWAVGMLVLLLALVVLGNGVPPTAVWIVPVMIPLVIYGLAASWILAAMGVFLRDIGQLVGVFTQILMFATPIFFPITIVPERYRTLLRLNPLTVIIEQARAVMVFGKQPDWWRLLVQICIACLLLLAGYLFFRKAKTGFADVL